MARDRVILDFQTMKGVANKHANDMNELILKANQDQMERAKGRLGDFVDEALGVLEVDVLIQRYQRLQDEMAQLNARYRIAVGKPTVKHRESTIDDVLHRESLIDRVERVDPMLPVELVSEIHAAAARHGLTLTGADTIKPVNAEEVLVRLRTCKTENEMMAIIMKNSLEVLRQCGVTTADLIRLAEEGRKKMIEQDDLTKPADLEAERPTEPTDPFHTLR